MTQSLSARIAHFGFAAFLLLFGTALTLLGGYLLYLGGSAYYLLAGGATLATAVLLLRGNPLAAKVFGVLLGITLLWSLYEADGYLLALLPRLATWLVLALWFFSPWYRESLSGPVESLSGQVESLSGSVESLSGSVESLSGPVKSLSGPEDGCSKEQPPREYYWVGVPAALGLLVLLASALQGYPHEGVGTTRGEIAAGAALDWRHWGGSVGGSRFSAADQINTDTVAGLREVWRIRTGVGEVFKSTPLQVGELLYVCAANNIVIALDSDSGSERWRYDPQVRRSSQNQYTKTCRGVAYHEAPPAYAGDCPARVVIAALDIRLIALNALTGEPCADFGSGGEVDLRRGLGITHDYQYALTAPALVAGDVLVVGAMVGDTQELGMPSGVVRAYDALSGAFVWAWDLGNPGYHGEPAAGETYTRGTPNVWTAMSYDPELKLVFAPTGNPPPDYYGGERRPFDDAYSSALVAIDATSGAERWKYQTVHHDIWDYDLPSQPVLVDVDRAGQRVPAVALPTKMGDIFLLDRRDGSQLYPMPERPAPQNPEFGEYLAPTQPVSALPHFHPYRQERDMWGLTPLDQLVCRVEYRLMRYEGMYTPPSRGMGTLLAPGNFGGFNWGSVSVDADNGLLVATPMLLAHRLRLFTPEQVAAAGPVAALLLGEQHPAVWLDPDAPPPAVREPEPDNPHDHARIRYYGLPQPFMSRLGTGVPCFEPPWSLIAVLDLNTRQLLWSRALGSMKEAGPFGLRSGLPFNVGVAVQGSTLTTRGGLTFMASTMDRTVRAFDLRNGEILWSAALPGNSQAQPMTFQSARSGRQYLIVTVPNPSWRYPRDPVTGTYVDSRGADGKGGYVIAYALSDE